MLYRHEEHSEVDEGGRGRGGGWDTSVRDGGDGSVKGGGGEGYGRDRREGVIRRSGFGESGGRRSSKESELQANHSILRYYHVYGQAHGTPRGATTNDRSNTRNNSLHTSTNARALEQKTATATKGSTTSSDLNTSPLGSTQDSIHVSRLDAQSHGLARSPPAIHGIFAVSPTSEGHIKSPMRRSRVRRQEDVAGVCVCVCVCMCPCMFVYKCIHLCRYQCI